MAVHGGARPLPWAPCQIPAPLGHLWSLWSSAAAFHAFCQVFPIRAPLSTRNEGIASTLARSANVP